MAKIKDIAKIDRPRERFLKKGPEALSKSDLLAILLGSGIKGKNVSQLSEGIIKKFGKNFLTIKVEDLVKISGIGQAKALQIVSAIELVNRYHEDDRGAETVIKSSDNVLSITFDLRDKKNEHLVCLYLNARNVLIKKETVSIGLLDKSLIHPREIFHPAVEINAASIVLVHNHPSGNATPSDRDVEVVKKIAQAGEIMGIKVLDFIITAKTGSYSFFESLSNGNDNVDYIADGVQGSLFDLMYADKEEYAPLVINKTHKSYLSARLKGEEGYFGIQNRRFLGNKYKLLGFIEDILNEKCNGFESFCDLFAGTGVVGERFNEKNIKVISNDILLSNYVSINAFLKTVQIDLDRLKVKIDLLNNIAFNSENYFSVNYGGTFFTKDNARKIGAIREEIDKIATNDEEKNVLITSLLYAVDKVANTVGHYDAYRKKLDSVQNLKLLLPKINFENNHANEIYQEDANKLIRKIKCDVLYIDPPYNSRQYCDAYHLLENLAAWQKPSVFGKAKKMDRSELKSEYCLKSAPNAFADLIRNAKCKHILVSYNNTGESRDGRSNARIGDDDILKALRSRGKVDIFERDYKAFTTGKSNDNGNAERIFYCEVIK